MLLSDFPVSMASAKLVGSFTNYESKYQFSLSNYDYDFIGIVYNNQMNYLAKNSSIDITGLGIISNSSLSSSRVSVSLNASGTTLTFPTYSYYYGTIYLFKYV